MFDKYKENHGKEKEHIPFKPFEEAENIVLSEDTFTFISKEKDSHEEVDTYFQFDDALTIGKSNSPAKLTLDTVTIDNSAIHFNHVNHPLHYNSNEIETMEMILLMFHDKPDYIKGALLFNIFKYRDRLGKKDSPGDREKMLWYLDKFELLFPDDFELYSVYHSDKGQ